MHEILFVSIAVLGFVGSIFMAVIYNVIYQSKFSWLGWYLGAIASVFLSYVFPSYMQLYLGISQLALISPLVISTLFFYLAIRNYKHSGIAHVRNLISEARIQKDEGDFHGAIRYYVKSALAARSHPNSKIAHASIESYDDLAVELVTVSILNGDSTRIIPFLTDCQKKLMRVEAYRQKSLKVDKILEILAEGSNIHLIFRMFLDTDGAKSFIDKLLGHVRAIKLPVLAAEYNYDEKMLQMFIETAIASRKIDGFLTTDKKTFMTKDFLREQLYGKLAS
jgi:hypothetical protein